MNDKLRNFAKNPIVMGLLAGVFLMGVLYGISRIDELLGIKQPSAAECSTCTLSNIAPPPVNGFVSKSEAPKAIINKEGENMQNLSEKNFTLVDTNGKSYSLAEMSGKIVYVKFWATWCPICMSGIEEVTALSKLYENNDKYAILTIASPGKNGEKNKEDFTKWFNGQGFGFTALLDDGGKIAAEYGVRGYPFNAFIGKDGKVYKTVIGHISNAKIEEVFKEME